MLFKKAPGKTISIVIIVYITLVLTVGACYLTAFNNIIVSLSPERNIEFLTKKAVYLRNYISIELLFISVFTICIMLIIKTAFTKLEAEKKKYEEIISTQKNEIERLHGLSSNLAELYNNSVEYDKMKTDFFSNVTHDLKTPLSVILGAIQLINKKYTASSGAEKGLDKNLKIINQNVYRLIRLINNILDITRLDSGYIKASMSNCNIAYIIEEITQSVSPYSESKGLSLIFDTDAEEVTTCIDIDKIEKAVLNLLSNAIKFTPAGGKVSVKVRNADNKVFILIKDTGPGIPKEKLGVIFERFKQADSELTRENEGSGIGLSIAKSFVELHGGSLTVKSEENKGSEFTIELPIRVSEEQYPEEQPHGDLRNGDPRNANHQNRIIEAINIEFSDIYHIA